MLNNTKFQVVPVVEALTKDRDIEINGLEAVRVDFGQICAGSPGSLKPGTITFEVRGLSHGHKAWIVQSDGKCQLMRETPSGEAEWLGEYPGVDAALQALARKVTQEARA